MLPVILFAIVLSATNKQKMHLGQVWNKSNSWCVQILFIFLFSNETAISYDETNEGPLCRRLLRSTFQRSHQKVLHTFDLEPRDSNYYSTPCSNRPNEWTNLSLTPPEQTPSVTQTTEQEGARAKMRISIEVIVRWTHLSVNNPINSWVYVAAKQLVDSEKKRRAGDRIRLGPPRVNIKQEKVGRHPAGLLRNQLNIPAENDESSFPRVILISGCKDEKFLVEIYLREETVIFTSSSHRLGCLNKQASPVLRLVIGTSARER